MGLVGCSTQKVSSLPFGAGPARYESGIWSDDSRLLLQCGPASEASITCQFGKERAGSPVESKNTVDFSPMTTRQSYIPKLLAEAVELELAQSPKKVRETPLSNDDLEPLRAVARRQDSCLVDKQYGGMLVVCPVPAQSSNVLVLFFHGACDRCRHQPVVLRKVK